MKPLPRVLCLALVLPATAHAWGREGHRIVADLADRYLDTAAHRQVRALLDLEGDVSMADVASWGDDVRRERPETGPWHYVDIPVHTVAGPAGYDPARDCPTGTCLVARLDAEETVLGDPHAEPHARLEALKWVIHLVGDLHQPLHCADDRDRGGNQVRVRFQNRVTNLHAVWDVSVLEQAGRSDLAYAIRLEALIAPTDAARWRQGTTAQWATESNDVARRVIYRNLPGTLADLAQGSRPRERAEPREPWDLPADYVQQMLPTVDDQLARAGVRLAAVLNERLGNRPR